MAGGADPQLRQSSDAKGCEMRNAPLLRIQLMLATFRWEKLPPRPYGWLPDYRMPLRAPGNRRICCNFPAAPFCIVS